VLLGWALELAPSLSSVSCYAENDGDFVTLEHGCLAHERASAIPHRDSNVNNRVPDGTIASPPGFPALLRVLETPRSVRRFVLFD
jgi:hypothetical protein